MSVLIVTYDLNREQTGGDREGLLQYIKTHSWARLSESSYAVATDKAPATVVEDGVADPGRAGRAGARGPRAVRAAPRVAAETIHRSGLRFLDAAGRRRQRAKAPSHERG